MRKLAIGLAIGTALLAGCSGSDGAQSSGGSDGDDVATEQYRGDAPESMPAIGVASGGGAAGDGVDALGVTGGAVLDVPAVGPSVIKTADVGVEVERDGFGDAMASVTEIASRSGGFVVTSTRSGEDSRRGSVTVRIPSGRFETALSEIRALGTVKQETISGEDVGQEFVDLEARLTNLEAQEAVLLRLFDDATSVADTIRIQGELSRVQLDIEQLEGRLRYLRDQTDLGTISVSLSEEGVSAPSQFGNAFDRAWDGILAVLAGIVIFLGYALPIVAVGLPLWFLVRRAIRVVEEKKA